MLVEFLLNAGWSPRDIIYLVLGLIWGIYGLGFLWLGSLYVYWRLRGEID